MSYPLPDKIRAVVVSAVVFMFVLLVWKRELFQEAAAAPCEVDVTGANAASALQGAPVGVPTMAAGVGRNLFFAEFTGFLFELFGDGQNGSFCGRAVRGCW